MSSTEIGALDVEPFESFYRREYARMVAIARALMRTGSSAEDLAQESFVAAHRNWDRISGYDDPGAWVRRVLINRATSLHRKAGAELRALTRLGGHAEDTIPELTPRGTEVWDEVRKLPRRQAQATVLHYVDQLSIEEICEVMGVSPGAVKAHLHKARAHLSKRLVAWGEETI
ncbi:MAG TPA: SigE family RNA polymerase sigma factor [Acidimicrobiia bacterium]|nr:SigE family RNA polymerase sigma factor [Acidimicrobiia bacterium]